MPVSVVQNTGPLKAPLSKLIIKGTGFSESIANNEVEFFSTYADEVFKGSYPPTRGSFKIDRASSTELEIKFDLGALNGLHGFVGKLLAEVSVSNQGNVELSSRVQVAEVIPSGPMAFSKLNLTCPLAKRKSPSMAVLNDKLYVFGGANDQQTFNDLAYLDLEKLEWHVLAPAGSKPAPRSNHSANFIGHRMFVFGGFHPQYECEETGDKVQMSDLWAYDVKGNSWSEITARGPSGSEVFTIGCLCRACKILDLNKGEFPSPGKRDSHAAWTKDDKLYIFGGNRLNNRIDGNYLAKGFFCFSPDHGSSSGVWESIMSPFEDDPLHTSLPLRRYPTVDVIGSKVLIFGGYPSHENGNDGRCNKVLSSDFHADVERVIQKKSAEPWKHLQAKGKPPESRDGSASAVLHGKICIAGGWGGGHPDHPGYANAFQLCPSTMTWDEVQSKMSTSRVAPGNAPASNYLYLFGGFRTDHYEVLNEVVKLGYPSVARGIPAPRVVNAGQTDMTIEWQDPVDCNCAHVTFYEVEYRMEDEDETRWLKCETLSQTEIKEKRHKQTGLKAGKRYCWRYLAGNSVGKSVFSPAGVGRTLSTAPEPPLAWVDTQSITASSMNVLWRRPMDNGSPITGYRLERRLHGSDNWVQIYQGASEEELSTGLNPSTCYDYRVRAMNELGWGPWSAKCSDKTLDWKVDTALTAEEYPLDVDAIDLLGNFTSNDPDHDHECLLTLQTSQDKESWANMAAAKKCEIREAFHKINRYFRLVVEHPNGNKWTSESLQLRLQPVQGKGVMLPGKALVDGLKTPSDTQEVLSQPDVELSPSTSFRSLSQADVVKDLEGALAIAQASSKALQSALQLSSARVRALTPPHVRVRAKWLTSGSGLGAVTPPHGDGEVLSDGA